ncbi:MAG: hypothetical protein IPJ23_16860 [Ignavibacteriales bacterium]|nr:hypothetical protein [Ignavibacteriales bacterium]
MLKKIENIASASEFKNNSRFVGGLHTLPGISSGKSSISDSLSFSNAFKYLSQLKWNLKSLEHSVNEEFLIEFGIDNFLFQTKVNIHDCRSNNIVYKIINEGFISSSTRKYQILLSFDFDSEVYTEPVIATDTQYLNRLFDRFNSYDSIISKNSNSPEVNDFLIDESQNYLRYEISLIHRNVIFFVEKIVGETFSKELRISVYNPEDKKLIRIQQINVKL